MSQRYYDETKTTLSLSEEDLFAALGKDIVGPQALPLRPAELVERGKRWLGAQQEYLREHICQNQTIRNFVTQTPDEASIAVELAKLIAELVLPVNPVVLAVLLVKKGLKVLCATHWR